MIQVTISALVSIAAILAFRGLALHYDFLVDHPTGRKQHACPTACVGGLGLMLATLVIAGFTTSLLQQAPWFFVAMSGLLILGLVDDLMDLAPRIKLLIETPLVVMAMLAISDHLDFGAGAVFDLSIAKTIGFAFGTFIVMGYINALNMADGIDGLAGGLALYFAVVIAGFAVALQDSALAGFSLSLVGAVLGFLVLNFRSIFGQRALVFMGDAGAMSLGFALGWLSLALAQRGMPEELVLWLMSYPAFDAVSTAIRRMLKKRSPFKADRTHMHHLLPRLGFSDTQTVLLIVISSALMSGLGVLLWLLQFPSLLVTACWLFAGVAYVFCSMFIEKQAS